MQQDIIDISVPVSTHTIVWPGDPPVKIRKFAELEADGVRVSELSMSIHTGTHIDAPAHYVADGATIDALPLDATVGPCVVLDLSGAGTQIGPDDLDRFDIRPGERVLLRTANSSRHLWGNDEFVDDFAYLTQDGAAYLATRRVRCVGIDYMSIGGPDDGVQTHRALMDSGVWIIESLDLRGVAPGEYALICLPLRLDRLEAAPARAILRELEEEGTPDFVDDAVEYASKLG